MPGMAAAGMSFSVLMIMMVTMHIRVINKCPCQKCLHRPVRITGDPSVKLYSGGCKRILRPAANPAAKQCIDTVLCQKSRECSVTASLCIYHLFPLNDAILDIIDLKLLCVSKMLKNHPILI